DRSFDVACRSNASSASSRPIPCPLSTIRISFRPPPSTSSRIRVAPASSEFSSSSFTTDAGRSTTSPAAIWFATWSERTRILPMLQIVSAPLPLHSAIHIPQHRNWLLSSKEVRMKSMEGISYEYRASNPEPSHSYLYGTVAGLLRDTPPGSKVLDLGCGNGTFISNFQDRGWSLYGSDFSPTGI